MLRRQRSLDHPGLVRLDGDGELRDLGLGLLGERDGIRVPLQALPPRAVVYDLVYHPRRTALLEAAARQGLRTVGGIDLLIRQAVRAFTFFTGETPDTAALYDALREPLGLES